MQFEIQWQRIIALNATGKENRMQKLQEEQGELAGALNCGRRQAIMSEGIDVLLMLLSIYGDHHKEDTDIARLGELASSIIKAFNKCSDSHYSIVRQYLIVAEQIGVIAELNQKIDGVASSTYKLDSADTTDLLENQRTSVLAQAMNSVIGLIASTEFSQDEIQAEYNMKMDKWENVSK